MLEALKEEVLQANCSLVTHQLVLFTWGNVSARDPETGRIVIKPSGVQYKDLRRQDMVVLEPDGTVVEGDYRPSSDTPTHLVLYRAFEQITGITHTHSTFATAFAQAGQPIGALGTTHADAFYGQVPCTRQISQAEVENAYEANTGQVIVECFDKQSLDPLSTPGVLVHSHGVFTFGTSAADSVYYAAALEEVAKMAWLTQCLAPGAALPPYLLEKHYKRKHGKDAYYGQK